MTEDQIKYMVDRFLGWRLPENFTPDAGISFKPMFNEHTTHPMRHEPSGTNLFDAVQADAMVRYMVDGIPATEGRPQPVAWRHKKRGSIYHEVGRAKLQVKSLDVGGLYDMQPVVVYRSAGDGSLWVRPEDEFEDGRFEKIAANAATSPSSELREALDGETIQTLLDLLNPLHGELDRQTYNEKVCENFNAAHDREYNVDITARMERDLAQAVAILETRKAALLGGENG